MLLCSLLIVEGGWRLPGPATGRSSSVTSELWSKACSSRGQSRKKNLNLNLKKYLNVKLDRCVILPSSPPDAEAVFPLCCRSGGDAELIHLHPSLWVDGLPASRAVRGEPPAVLNHLLPGVFTVWCSSGFFFSPCFCPSASGAPILLRPGASAERSASLSAASLSMRPTPAPRSPVLLSGQWTGHSQLREGLPAAV